MLEMTAGEDALREFLAAFKHYAPQVGENEQT